MATTANLIIQASLTLSFLFVTALQVGVADEDGFFSLLEREK
jgi:hypothetical protein